ncbi:recombinase family protein [Corynebacterium rouxii]|uniref:Recombinase family protein n=1 Tax=Corynebacterium rouxii TaxID=2719119 RepID=A0ABU3PLZ7_9CORY|nr:recombinase family protein [Corynebacterium rouxii]MDT9408271.1 recombinase family protein [Corynebacterium rouxii]MDT9410450.1 recombinase family protein [Corynebacterium rouxii]
MVTELTECGVVVEFLKENQTYTATSDPVARLMWGGLGSIAEFGRSLIRERQAEGIARAKARGVHKGRAKAKVARRLGIGRTTLYKYIFTYRQP